MNRALSPPSRVFSVLIYTCQHHPAPATRSRSLVSQSIITALFRRFVGRQTNYPPQTARALDPTAAYHERAKGIQLMDMT
jgi:hypothetical protein